MELGDVHGLVLFNFFLLFVVAEVQVGWGARWSQVFVGECLEVCVRSAAFVFVAHRVGGAGDVPGERVVARVVVMMEWWSGGVVEWWSGRETGTLEERKGKVEKMREKRKERKERHLKGNA